MFVTDRPPLRLALRIKILAIFSSSNSPTTTKSLSTLILKFLFLFLLSAPTFVTALSSLRSSTVGIFNEDAIDTEPATDPFASVAVEKVKAPSTVTAVTASPRKFL